MVAVDKGARVEVSAVEIEVQFEGSRKSFRPLKKTKFSIMMDTLV